MCGNTVRRGSKIAQWTKGLATKLGDLSLIPTWTDMVEGEKLSSDTPTLALGHGYLHSQRERERGESTQCSLQCHPLWNSESVSHTEDLLTSLSDGRSAPQPPTLRPPLQPLSPPQPIWHFLYKAHFGTCKIVKPLF